MNIDLQLKHILANMAEDDPRRFIVEKQIKKHTKTRKEAFNKHMNAHKKNVMPESLTVNVTESIDARVMEDCQTGDCSVDTVFDATLPPILDLDKIDDVVVDAVIEEPKKRTRKKVK